MTLRIRGRCISSRWKILSHLTLSFGDLFSKSVDVIRYPFLTCWEFVGLPFRLNTWKFAKQHLYTSSSRNFEGAVTQLPWELHFFTMRQWRSVLFLSPVAISTTQPQISLAWCQHSWLHALLIFSSWVGKGVSWRFLLVMERVICLNWNSTNTKNVSCQAFLSELIIYSKTN